MKKGVLVFILLAGISTFMSASSSSLKCKLSSRECFINGYKVTGSIPSDWELEDLQKIVQIINEYPGVNRIELIGYTDTEEIMGDKELSYVRAENVHTYMKIFGLREDIEVNLSGEGKNNPIMTNTTEEGRYSNRRVDIRFFVKEN
ncbi:OmpA family protein [Sebaldella sp. S0638]|uniref:OmpA family protein n=1 Tax=Sebaldella sp. S0638 TaxID=2957809 RepID=UPI0020A06986|nr:OmpA family protein [Sebaldella sp. S0638]MCP1224627.1 OmpA family protein [Sebaldella sp. S0638]